MRKLNRITEEEFLRSIAQSIAPATDAAHMARFVGSLYDSMCNFIAKPGSAKFFMTDGDVHGV